jgi:tyrosinase
LATIKELQNRARSFLKSNRPSTAPATAMRETSELKFTPFLPELLKKALQISDQFMTLANSESEEQHGLEKVLQQADRLAIEEDLELVKYALMIFITHSRRGSRLPIPPLEERSPEKFLVNRKITTTAATAADVTEVIGEEQIDWYREDVLANAHHEHWHIVYPMGGIPDGNGVMKTKDRQGELFFYMHRQMLARYDTERLAVGLDRVKSLSRYDEKISEAYDSGLPGYRPRPSGLQLSDVQIGTFNYTVREQELRRDRILNAVDSKYFEKEDGTRIIDVNTDLLGATEEATIASVSGNDHTSFYGNHHGMGHVLISLITNPQGNLGEPFFGVMADPSTAIRDPIFYRWHKHIDDISFRWEEQQQPNDLSDGPQALIRKNVDNSTIKSPDIILSFNQSIPGSDNPDFNGFAYGEETFGGENWDKDFSLSDNITTNELHTMMLEREIQLGDNQNTTTITYLDQKEFCYFIRAENKIDRPKDVTVRIFLVAKSEAEDRRMWIEMDKFRYKLGPLQRAVIFRPAQNSSVIRKPATKPPKPIEKAGAEPGATYCNCGWPYNLLVPRATRDGMQFRLMVMLTDWDKDKVGEDSTCGSMSFCGSRDRYPDSRGMGYPFDRPFPNGQSIAQTIEGYDNMAARDINIRWIK